MLFILDFCRYYFCTGSVNWSFYFYTIWLSFYYYWLTWVSGKIWVMSELGKMAVFVFFFLVFFFYGVVQSGGDWRPAFIVVLWIVCWLHVSCLSVLIVTSYVKFKFSASAWLSLVLQGHAVYYVQWSEHSMTWPPSALVYLFC